MASMTPAIPASMWTTVPPAKSLGATAASPSAPLPKISEDSPPSALDRNPPPQTMWASGKYTRVTQTIEKTTQVEYFIRSATEPDTSATVMMANVSWKATKVSAVTPAAGMKEFETVSAPSGPRNSGNKPFKPKLVNGLATNPPSRLSDENDME